MKNSIWGAALLLASLTFGQEYKIGSKVGDFSFKDLKGNSVRFSQVKGGITVVAFISTKCPISNAYSDRMEKLYREYSAKGVKFVFLNANQNEPPAEVEEHAKSAGYTFPVYKDADNVAADLFGAQFTPDTYVIDQSG